MPGKVGWNVSALVGELAQPKDTHIMRCIFYVFIIYTHTQRT